MAQLRQDYGLLTAQGAAVLAVGPDSPSAFQAFWREHDIPFVGLADPEHIVARQYGQQVRLLKWGRMPALLIVDKAGIVRYAHYGESMSDIPTTEELLDVLVALNREDAAPRAGEHTAQ